MKELRVLHIINNLGSGGAEKLLSDMLPNMNGNEGIQIDLLLLCNKGNVFDEELKSKGVNIDIIPIKQPKIPLNIFYIKKYIVNSGYDIVHAHLFPTLYWTSMVAKLIFKGKPKFFYTEHSTHNRRRDKKKLRYLERIIYSSFDKIISISDSTQKNLLDWLNPIQKDIKKFTVINNGININKFKEAEPYDKSIINNKFSNDTKLLCMVGRFSEAKDQPTIIKAMKNIPENVHLLLVGEGPLRSDNEKLASDIGVSDRVHFLGFRNDVERIFKTSDIIVQSSNWEGFGLAVVEGMATGKPVIASDVEGLREVVEGAGILFEKGNSNQLAGIINDLYKDVNTYSKVKETCSIRVEKFNIDKMISGYLEVYKLLV